MSEQIEDPIQQEHSGEVIVEEEPLLPRELAEINSEIAKIDLLLRSIEDVG